MQDGDRMTRDGLKVRIILLLGCRSTCLRRSVGCIITREDRILSTGYNGLPAGLPNCCDTGVCLKEQNQSEEYKICLHAEQNALAFCAKYGLETAGAELYVNADICMTCAKLVIASGIKKVVILRDHGGKVGDLGIDLLKRCSVRVELWNDLQAV